MGNEKEPRPEKRLKFLGAHWMNSGPRGEYMRQVFSMEDLRWMMARAEAQGGKCILSTDKKRGEIRKGDPTHKAVCIIAEGEFGWDDPSVNVHNREKTIAAKAIARDGEPFPVDNAGSDDARKAPF